MEIIMGRGGGDIIVNDGNVDDNRGIELYWVGVWGVELFFAWFILSLGLILLL